LDEIFRLKCFGLSFAELAFGSVRNYSLRSWARLRLGSKFEFRISDFGFLAFSPGTKGQWLP